MRDLDLCNSTDDSWFEGCERGIDVSIYVFRAAISHQFNS